MRCKYCHNPDSWEMNTGKSLSTDDLLSEYNKYKDFSNSVSNSGITATGGEPLAQMDFLIELFTKAKKQGIHTTVDTCGGNFKKDNPIFLAQIKELMDVTDLVMLDIKHINDGEHKILTGISNKKVIDFARYLDEIKKPVRIRHVVVPNITLNNKFLYQTGLFLGSLSNIESIEILPYHLMGIHKWQNMGKKYPLEGTPEPSKEEIKMAKLIIRKGISDYKKS